MYSILIDNKAVAQTPKHLGVNVEVQDHHERCNLWDWLLNSGATILREFHPEKNFLSINKSKKFKEIEK